MKKLILPVILVFGMSLLFSCAKKNDGPSNTTPTSGFSATVAGTPWSAKTFTATTNAVTTTIRGTAADGSYMQFSMPATVQVGKDSLTQSGNYSYQYNNNVTAYIVRSGTVNISSYANKVMVGTFSATISDPSTSKLKFVSGGSFTAIFQ